MAHAFTNLIQSRRYTGNDEEALEAIQSANRLASAGDFVGAVNTLWPLWNGSHTFPNVGSLSKSTAAELYLCAGRLQSGIDIEKGSQSFARRLVRAAASLFSGLSNRDGTARCLKELALSYWRDGHNRAARRVLSSAASIRNECSASTLLALAVMISIVESCDGKLEAAHSVLRRAAPLTEVIDDDELLGSFHNSYGLRLKQSGAESGDTEYLQQSFIEFTAASYYFEKSGNIKKLAAVENNLGSLLTRLGEHEQAYPHIKRARTLALSIGDLVHAAWFEHTLANVLLNEGRLQEARRVIEQSFVALDRLGATAYLIEVKETCDEIKRRLDELTITTNSRCVIPFTMPLPNLPERFKLTASDDSLINASIKSGDAVWFSRDAVPEEGDLIAVSTPAGLLMRFYFAEDDEVLLLGAHEQCPEARYSKNLIRVRGVAFRQ